MNIIEILVRVIAAVAIMGVGFVISSLCMGHFERSAKDAIASLGDGDSGTGEDPDVENATEADTEEAGKALASASGSANWTMLLLSVVALGAAWVSAITVLRLPLWATVLSAAVPVHMVFSASRRSFASLFNFVLELMCLVLIAIASLVTGIAGIFI